MDAVAGFAGSDVDRAVCFRDDERVGLQDAVLPWRLARSALTAGLLTMTAWIGAELAYRHMIGVTRGTPVTATRHKS